MMYGWPNVGTQKRKMGEESIWPCCGIEEEDQIHLYHCQHEEMQNTLRTAIAKANTALVKQGITTPVYTPFINMICQAKKQDPLSSYKIKCEATLEYIKAQRTLGTKAVLQGFHHVDLFHLLRETRKQPKKANTEKETKKERWPEPIEQAASMAKASWDIFERLWECRNNILHSNNSKVLEQDKDTVTGKLIQYRQHNQMMLRQCDRFIIMHHPESDVIKWTFKRKLATLDLLDNLHKLYNGELKREKTKYRDIASYLITKQDTRPPQALPSAVADQQPEPEALETLPPASSPETSPSVQSVEPEPEALAQDHEM